MTIIKNIDEHGFADELVTEETHFEVDTLQPDDHCPTRGRLEMEAA